MCGLSIAQTKQKLMETLLVCSRKIIMSSNSAFLFIVVSTAPTAHPPGPQGKIVCSLLMSLIVSPLNENSSVRERYFRKVTGHHNSENANPTFSKTWSRSLSCILKNYLIFFVGL